LREYYDLTGQTLPEPAVTLSSSKASDKGVGTGLVAIVADNVETIPATQANTTASASAPVVSTMDLGPVDSSIFHTVTPATIL
jgi:hypothetical protein